MLLNSTVCGADPDSTSIEKDAEDGIGVGPGIGVAVGVTVGVMVGVAVAVAVGGTPVAGRGACVGTWLAGWGESAGEAVRSAVVVTSPVHASAAAAMRTAIEKKSVRFMGLGSKYKLSAHHH